MSRPLCPRCSKEYVKRVSRVGLGEQLETIAKEAVNQPREVIEKMKKLLGE